MGLEGIVSKRIDTHYNWTVPRLEEDQVSGLRKAVSSKRTDLDQRAYGLRAQGRTYRPSRSGSV